MSRYLTVLGGEAGAAAGVGSAPDQPIQTTIITADRRKKAPLAPIALIELDWRRGKKAPDQRGHEPALLLWTEACHSGDHLLYNRRPSKNTSSRATNAAGGTAELSNRNVRRRRVTVTCIVLQSDSVCSLRLTRSIPICVRQLFAYFLPRLA